MDDIGAAVGVSGPAIYRHFKGKDAVLAAVLEVNAARVADAVGQAGPTIADVVGRAVAAALEHPAGLATYLRERHRLTDAPPVMVEQERQIRAAWRAALTSTHRRLQRIDVDLRQAAVVGALGAVSGRTSPSVPRPRLDAVITSSATAMLLARPSRETKPTPAAKPAWQPPPSRRDEILRVALRRFRERGFAGVGIDEVGEAVGITGPTVYHHYASKAEILVDAYDRAGERVAVGADDALASATSAADAMERLARSYVGVAIDNVDLIVVTATEQAALPADEWPRLARRGRAIRDGWASVIRELQPDLSESEARLVVRMALPLVNHAVQVEPRREAIVDLVVAFCRGL